jgi:hypothetical protein
MHVNPNIRSIMRQPLLSWASDVVELISSREGKRVGGSGCEAYL